MKPINAVRFAGFCTLLSLAAMPARSASHRQPHWPQVAVAPIVIEAQPVEGAPRRADEVALKKTLAEAALQEAISFLVKDHLAITAEVAPAVLGSAPRGVTLSGTIHLPLSLPPGVVGLRAADRKGTFATANFTLLGADEKPLAETTVALKWDDVRWLTGGPKRRRYRKLDEVLTDAVRKVAVRGVKQLADQSETVNAKR